MSADDPYIGEIIAWGGNFAPVNWLPCDGRLLPIAQFESLFQLLGTTFGGDGVNTFALPDMRGRVMIDQGPGYVIGQIAGSESVSLIGAQVAPHSHPLQAAAAGDASVPTGRFPAPSRPADLSYGDPTAFAPMYGGAIGVSGSSQPHENMQPFLAVNFIICVEGIFPPQP